VLCLDKKENAVKLDCKWVGDLTKTDEAMVHSCDEAFDKAKATVARYAQNKREPKPIKPVHNMSETPSKATQSKPSKLSLKFDLCKGRLSHILKLKELFTEHKGEMPVEIDFIMDGHPRASLKIDSRWGINLSTAFQDHLQNIPGIEIMIHN
jgi:DNA polymerase-3 subunit alpha